MVGRSARAPRGSWTKGAKRSKISFGFGAVVNRADDVTRSSPASSGIRETVAA